MAEIALWAGGIVLTLVVAVHVGLNYWLSGPPDLHPKRDG